LKQVSSGKTSTLYRKGQIVFHEGSPPLACFCVYSGRVKLYRTDLDGKHQIVSIAGPSDLIGHHALWLQKPHAVTAQMLEDGYLCVIERSTLTQLLERDSGLALELLKRTTQELEDTQARLADRSHRSARSRLACALLRLWESRGADGKGRTPDHILVSRQDLADLIGTAQETAIRLLAELKEIKAVSARGSRITVIRPDLLRERSEPPY